MANLITLFRLGLVFVIVAISLYAPPSTQLLNAPLIIINILLDALDGLVARVRNETSVFGAIFDIAADRITEIVLWLILAKIGMISIWIAIIFVTRGILVDSLRKSHTNSGEMPFDIMQTRIGKFLVASRTMRFASGLSKITAFSWFFLLAPSIELWPEIVSQHADFVEITSIFLLYSAVAISLVRGIPVIFEALVYNKRLDRDI